MQREENGTPRVFECLIHMTSLLGVRFKLIEWP